MDIGVRINVNTGEIAGTVRRLQRHLANDGAIKRNIGIAMRNYVRQTLQMGGRRYRHAPLSWWTTMRTGRRKPLRDFPKHIQYTVQGDEVIVFYGGPQHGWNTWMHHGGYRIPPVRGKLMHVPFARGKGVWFRSKKGANVPAREIWPTQREARDLVRGMARDWIAEGVSRAWRP